MFRRLDDNERGAFNYLFGGVLLVVVVRGLFFAVDRLGAPATADEAAFAVYRQGYLASSGTPLLVATTAGRLERIAFAALLSLATACIAAGAVYAVARMLRRTPGPAALTVGRVVLALVLGWSLYAALFVPVRSTRPGDGVLVVRSYRCALRDVPVPFTATEERLTRSDIQWIEAVDQDPVRGCDGRVLVHAVAPDGHALTLARRTGICPEQQLQALRDASAVAALLERELR